MTPPAAAAVPATRPVPARPDRPTRPRTPSRARPGTQRRPRHVAAPARRSARVGALAGNRLLDRLISGRVWIGLVAFALIGIVAMQLWLLKLNGGIGRAIEHEALLQRVNATLSAEDSAQSAGDLVERQAVADGMRIVPPGALLFLHTRGSADERWAAARLAQPVQTPATGTTTTEATSTAARSEAVPTTAQPEPGH